MGVLGALGLHASSASATTTLRVAIGTLSTEAAGDAALEGLTVGMFIGNVFGQLDMHCARFFLLGKAKGFSHTARDIV